MAVTKLISGENVIDGAGEDVSELSNDDDNDLSSIFAEFGGAPDDKTYKMKVYRVIPDKAEMAWLFNCVPSELPIDNRLRDEYKGGRFEIRIYEMRGGRFFLKKRPHVLIEPPVKSVESVQQSDLASVLKALADNQERQFVMLKETMLQATGRQATPTDPIAMMTSMMTAMSSMKEFISPPQPSNSLRDTIETLAALKELMPERGDRETNFMDIIGKAMESPILGMAVQQLAKPQPVPQVTVQPPRVVNTPQPAPAVETTEAPAQQEISDMQYQQVVQLLKLLVYKAAKNGDPALAAGNLIEELGPEFAQNLLAPDAIDKAAMLNPEVNKYRPWFQELQMEIAEFLKPDEFVPSTDHLTPDP